MPIAAEPPPPSAAKEEPSPPNAPASASDADKQKDTRAANGFALSFFVRAAKQRGNVMVSGTSMRHALGAAYLGARGATAKEMATALALPDDKQKAAALARADIEAWRATKGAELSVANHLWIEKSAPVKSDYAALAAWAFDAPAENVDFKKAPDEARKGINGWVAQKTQDKIKELLPQGSVEPLTRFVVTNAIYFKGRWGSPFPKDATKDEPFETDAKKKVNVPTMHVTDQLALGSAPGMKLLELPYIGGLAMLVVLPDDANELAKIEEKLSASVFDVPLAKTRVALSLPRFTFEWGGATKAMLQELGLKTAFTDRADFGAIADGKLSVSDVFQKTWIAVDEEGTEAAAATGTVMRTTSLALGQATPFKVDRPFLFFIRGNGKILFAGRVTTPK